MSFLNAMMLACVPAGVLPVVIHWLSRARFRRVEWGAMQLLATERGKRFDRSQVTQFLLLGLRCGAVVALALALARPVIGRFSGSAQQQWLAVVIVIDASPSMSHMEYNQTRLDIARREALSVLERLQRGDQAGLVVLGQPATRDVALTGDLQEIATRLASLQVGLKSAEMSDGLRRAAGVLASATEGPREIYLIGDRQFQTWASIFDTPEAIRSTSRIVAIPVGSTDRVNSWIESVKLAETPAVVGAPVDLVIRLRNGGSVARNDLNIVSAVDGAEIDRFRATVDAGAAVELRRTVTFASAGAKVLEVSTDRAGASADDSALLALDVVTPIDVLAIGKDNRYLRAALTPFDSAGEVVADPFRLRFAHGFDGAFASGVVVLSDVSDLEDASVQMLESFVSAGGGLLLAPTEIVNVHAWNDRLYRDGAGLAPAAIGSIARSETGEAIAPVSEKQPMLALLSAGEFAGVRLTSWTRFANTAPQAALIRSKSGDPLLLEQSFGRGRVMMLAIPVDRSGSNITSTNVFLPLVQTLVRYLGTASITDRNLPIGETIQARFQNPRERFGWIARPDGRSERVPMSMSGNTAILTYATTDVPGRYIARTSSRPAVEFVVHGDTGESGAEYLGDAELQAILDRASIDRVDTGGVAMSVGSSRESSELTSALLMGVVGLLGLEMLLRQRQAVPVGSEAG